MPCRCFELRVFAPFLGAEGRFDSGAIKRNTQQTGSRRGDTSEIALGGTRPCKGSRSDDREMRFQRRRRGRRIRRPGFPAFPAL
jgi:hypothetical protein